MTKRRETSRYTLYLLIFVVAIILVVGLLSVSGSVNEIQSKSAGETAAKQINHDTAVATVSFVILPHPDSEGGE